MPIRSPSLNEKHFSKIPFRKLAALTAALMLGPCSAESHVYCEMRLAMARPPSLSYMDAFRYVAAWASFDHDNVTDLTQNPHDFYGHLGSLDFLYSESDHTLRAFSFVGAGMGLLLSSRAEVKSTLDQTAREHPTETANGVFDIRTLPWNRQVTPKLEPCLYLRMDIGDSTVLVSDMVKRLNDFSTAGYTWHAQKLLHVFADYWKAHPELAKRPIGQR